jgi:hypothetical protein
VLVSSAMVSFFFLPARLHIQSAEQALLMQDRLR